MVQKCLFLILIVICFSNCGGSKRAGNYVAKKIHQTENKNYISQLNSGVDFTAQGNEPAFWELTINFEDSTHFKTADGILLTFATNRCNRTETAIGIKLYTKIKNENIAINIFKSFCNDKEKIQKITIDYLGKTYTGCGSYLKNPALNNKWILYKLRNNFVDNYSTIPTFHIDLKKNKLIINDGCNKINGSIIVEGDKIIFDEFKLTVGKCSDTEFTSLLKNQISKNVATYYFKNEMLYLYLIDDSLLIFKKSN